MVDTCNDAPDLLTDLRMSLKSASDFSAATVLDASDLLKRLLGLSSRLGAGTKGQQASLPAFLKDPHGLSPSDWKLCLPPHFNSPLDLKYIYRTQSRDGIVVRRWKEWSQGSAFDFHAGSLIYDRPFRDEMTWGEKLEIMDFFLEIEAARPATPANRSGGERDPGSVTLKFYEPRGEKVIITGREVVTQDQLVHFAITGRFTAIA